MITLPKLLFITWKGLLLYILQLYNLLSKVLESMNGVKGYRVYSNQNNNTIFIPFTGMYVDNEIIDFSNYGAYWTSSLQPHGDLFHSGSSTAKVFVLSEKDVESEVIWAGWAGTG